MKNEKGTKKKKAHNNAMSSTVVAACDGPKALLASSIPLNQKNVQKHQCQSFYHKM